MPVFHYQATDKQGVSSNGTIRSETPRAARDLLRGQGLQVSSLSEAGSQTNSRWLTPSKATIAQSLSDLAVLLGVGVPLDESLHTLAQQSRGTLKSIWQRVLDDVASGRSLADAMRDQESVFDPLTIAMVQVGENAGNLDEILSQLGRFQQRSASQKGKVINAILYPGIILLVAGAVTLFLMTNVLPSLLENLMDLGKQLPWPTRVLQAVSSFLTGYWPWLVGAIGTLTAGFLIVRSSEAGRRALHHLWLRLPVIGPLIVKQEISRVSLVLSVLLRSGMEFVRAMELSEASTSNVVVRQALTDCRMATQRGRDISEALQGQQWMPPVVVQVFAMGQASGRLEELLDKLANDYDQQVETMVTRLSGLIEPILIVVLSIVIGFVVFATFLPILEAGNVL